MSAEAGAPDFTPKVISPVAEGTAEVAPSQAPQPPLSQGDKLVSSEQEAPKGTPQ